MTESEIIAALDTVLPGKAYLILVPQDTPEPYFVLQRIWQGPVNTMGGYESADQVRYQIDSYGKTHKQALANMEAAIASLRACPDPPLVENEQDLYEQDTRLHRTMVDISTWYHDEGVPQ
ncbi:DUF3168 domain-containing protein [Paraburkholderia sp. RL18-103-BIB-C]|uniref:DUF3168 domain-containing protein n=1 Tax=Paraburkholderia sp. RL18-103-BIB-C TaxID=3031637 RepID=UPI0038BC4D1B